jgi:hypothetical protein
MFLFLQEVYCNDRFVLHGWQPRPTYNTSTPSRWMCHHYSPRSFSWWVWIFINCAKIFSYCFILQVLTKSHLYICRACAEDLSSFSDELLPILERLENLKEVLNSRMFLFIRSANFCEVMNIFYWACWDVRDLLLVHAWFCWG